MSYIKDLKIIFKNYEEKDEKNFKKNKLTVDPILFAEFEFALYALYSAIGEFQTSNANLYFTQYRKRFFSNCNSNKEHLFYILRKNHHKYYNKKQFQEDLKEYLAVHKKFRLFAETNDGIIIKNKQLLYLIDRYKVYDKKIDNYMLPTKKDIDFIQEQGFYQRTIRTNQELEQKDVIKTLYFDIGDRDVEDFDKLPAYRNKCQLSLPLDFDWNSFKSTLGPNWAERPTIKIKSNDSFDNTLEYKGLVHIVGLLGAGKSTYITLETLRLLEESKIKIGIVVPNVAQALITYKFLDELGVKATPIIGATQLAKHRQRFMNSNLTLANSFNEVSKDEMKPLDFLSGFCMLSHFANDPDIIESQYPCNRLKKEWEKVYYNCPLFNECGYFNKYVDLKNSDVWITTSHSLLASKANQIIDPQKRTYFELFHDCLDIIFVDEADTVQEDFDHKFMDNEIFYGSDKSIMRKFQETEDFLQRNHLANSSSEAHKWNTNQKHLNQLLNRIEYMTINAVYYREFLIQNTLTPRSLYYSLIKDISNRDSKQSQNFIKSIETFLLISEELKFNEELMNHELYILYDKLTKCPNAGDTTQLIENSIQTYVEKYDITIKPSNKYNSEKMFSEKMFNKKLELYIYIVLIDYFFRIQNITLANLARTQPQINEIFTPFKFFNKDFLHLLTESVVGNIFGYKLVIDDNNRLRIHLLNYSGIGRSLIEEWPYMKEEIGKNGPAVVLLSGTSFAPSSAHFHIDKEPTFVLQSEKPEGSIHQFINIKHNKKGDAIRISGVSDRFLKQENLIELTNNLLNDFKFEIKYWNKQGVNRKVLVVVNSYEQCRLIGDYLRGQDITYKILSNSKDLKDDEFTASQIEKIPSLGNFDVVVAPLSIISRGYNIVDTAGNSYFGSAFFLIRPYVSPEDLTYNYQILNSITAPMVKEERSKGNSFSDTLTTVQKFAYGMLDEFNEKKFWKRLSTKQREILSWYTYIPVKQTVGRMQRNGCDCRVFYCDASFVNGKSDSVLNSSESMLKAWQEVLKKDESDIGKMLYGNYLKGLNDAINNYENLFVKKDEEDLY